MKYIISYIAKKEWDEIRIFYYLKDELFYEPMVKQDEVTWSICIDSNVELQFYGFLLNNRFWEIDKKKDFCFIDKLPYSVYGTSANKVEIKSFDVVTCKDMKSDVSQPIQISNYFNSLDKHIIIWYKIHCSTNELKKIIVGIEITNPLQEIALLDYTVHSINIKDNVRIGFIDIPTHSQMLSGKWKYTLFVNEEILASNEFIFTNISSQLSSKVDNAMRIDLKI